MKIRKLKNSLIGTVILCFNIIFAYASSVYIDSPADFTLKSARDYFTARLLQKSGLLKEAKEILLKIVRKNTRLLPYAYLRLADIYSQLKNIQLQEFALKHALKSASINQTIYSLVVVKLAKFYLKTMNMPEKCVSTLKLLYKSSFINSQWEFGMFQLGITLKNYLHKDEEALKVFIFLKEKAISENIRILCYILISQLYENKGKFRFAISYLNILLTRFPNSPYNDYAIFSVALYHVYLKKFNVARRFYKVLAENYPESIYLKKIGQILK